VLRDVRLPVRKGEIVVVIGPSGATAAPTLGPGATLRFAEPGYGVLTH
jgi:ABC-type transporter Mla maintaining outer membrane lipid asymmetry ATPase subunit MlaF